jgi:hypothetical protein
LSIVEDRLVANFAEVFEFSLGHKEAQDTERNSSDAIYA